MPRAGSTGCNLTLFGPGSTGKEAGPGLEKPETAQAPARDSWPDSTRTPLTASLGETLDCPRGATPRRPLTLDSDSLAGSPPKLRTSAAREHMTRTVAERFGSHLDAVQRGWPTNMDNAGTQWTYRWSRPPSAQLLPWAGPSPPPSSEFLNSDSLIISGARAHARQTEMAST